MPTNPFASPWYNPQTNPYSNPPAAPGVTNSYTTAQPTAGPYGPQGATTTSTGGQGGQFGSASGLLQGPNWLTEPTQAVNRAMSRSGMAIGSFNPMAQAIRQNANNLVYTLLARNVNPGTGGQTHITNLVDNEYMMNGLTDLVQRAAKGERVLGGWQPQQVAAIGDLYRQANAGSTDPGVNNIAAFLSDPDRAAVMASSLLYGGLHRAFQPAAAAPFASAVEQYNQLLEQSPQFGEQNSIIDILLGNTRGPTPGNAALGRVIPQWQF